MHAVLLRPLLDLEGASWLADTLLHVAVPLLAVVSWALVGPRPRTDVRSGALAMLWPVAWLVWTLVVGAVSGWYPYPFLDVGEEGAEPSVVLDPEAVQDIHGPVVEPDRDAEGDLAVALSEDLIFSGVYTDGLRSFIEAAHHGGERGLFVERRGARERLVLVDVAEEFGVRGVLSHQAKTPRMR